MRFNEERIRELVAKGEDVEILRLIADLRRRLLQKTRLLSQQADVAANLRHAYMETELDRDRLQRMCTALYELCRSTDRREEGEEIAKRYGGIAGHGESEVIG